MRLVKTFVRVSILGVMLVARVPALALGETHAFDKYDGHDVEFRLLVDGQFLPDGQTVGGLDGTSINNQFFALLGKEPRAKWPDLALDEDGEIAVKGRQVHIRFVYMDGSKEVPLPEYIQILWYREVRNPILDVRDKSAKPFYDFRFFKKKPLSIAYQVDGKDTAADKVPAAVHAVRDVLSGKAPMADLKQGDVGELKSGTTKFRLMFKTRGTEVGADGRALWKKLSWAVQDYLAQKIVRQNGYTARRAAPGKEAEPAPPPGGGGNGGGGTVSIPTPVKPAPGDPKPKDPRKPGTAKTVEELWEEAPGVSPPGVSVITPETPKSGNPKPGNGTAPPKSKYPRPRTTPGDCSYQFVETGAGVFDVFIQERDGLAKLFSIPGNLKSLACHNDQIAVIADRIAREPKLLIEAANSPTGSNIDFAETEQGGVKSVLFVIKKDKLVVIRRAGPAGEWEKVKAVGFIDGNDGFKVWPKGNELFTVEVMMNPALSVRAATPAPRPTEAELNEAK